MKGDKMKKRRSSFMRIASGLLGSINEKKRELRKLKNNELKRQGELF